MFEDAELNENATPTEELPAAEVDQVEGEQQVVNQGSVLSGNAGHRNLIEELTPHEIDARAGALLDFDSRDEVVPDEELFDFEVTDELRQLASGYETLGDTIAQGWLPSALVADLLFPDESTDKPE